MILIKNVEVLIVDGNETRITKLDHIPCSTEEYQEQLKTHIEIVRGRKFVNCRGEEICLGIKRDVQDLLGLPFYEAERNTKIIGKQYEQINTMTSRIIGILNATLWQRIKFLFTKKI